MEPVRSTYVKSILPCDVRCNKTLGMLGVQQNSKVEVGGVDPNGRWSGQASLEERQQGFFLCSQLKPNPGLLVAKKEEGGPHRFVCSNTEGPGCGSVAPLPPVTGDSCPKRRQVSPWNLWTRVIWKQGLSRCQPAHLRPDLG